MLINTTEELKQFIPSSVSLDFEDIKPYLETAEVKIASDFLTISVLNFLKEPGLNPTEIVIKSLVSGTVALLALKSYLDFGQITVSSAGIHFSTTENTKTAFEWQITNLKRACLSESFTKIESLYVLIPDASIQFRTLYQASDIQRQTTSLLLNSTKEFSRHLSIGNSNVFYFKLINSILEAEEHAKEQISPQVFELLKTIDTDSHRARAIAQIKQKTGRYCAYAAMAQGVVENVSILGEFGVQLLNGTFSRLSDSTLSTTDKMLDVLTSYYTKQADKTMSELIMLCQKLFSLIPEYSNSVNFLEENETLIPRNSPDAPIVFL